MRTGIIIAATALTAAAGVAGTAHAVPLAGGHAAVAAHAGPAAPTGARTRAPRSAGPILAWPIGDQTSPVTALTPTSATLNGTVNAYFWPVLYRFNYGTSTAYGRSAPATTATLGAAAGLTQTVRQSLTGLTPATTYHYQLVAGVNNIVAETGDQTFTTPRVLPATPTTTTTTATSTTPTTPTPTPAPTAPAAVPATPTPSPAPAAAAPVVGQSAVVGAASGTVYVTDPGSSTPVALTAGANVPLGAVIDATHGVAEVTNALAGAGRTQSVSVWAGRFTMTQSRTGRTTFHLVGAPSCGAGPHALVAHRKPVTLWAHDHHGRYTTRGNNSVATVRGTVWETIESCAGTRTVVRRGVVSVRDLHTGRSVLVHAGHSVLVGP